MTNSTNRTNQRIIQTLRESDDPVTISQLSNKSKIHFHAVKDSLNFLSSVGLIKIITNGNVSFVYLSDSLRGVENEESNWIWKMFGDFRKL